MAEPIRAAFQRNACPSVSAITEEGNQCYGNKTEPSLTSAAELQLASSRVSASVDRKRKAAADAEDNCTAHVYLPRRCCCTSGYSPIVCAVSTLLPPSTVRRAPSLRICQSILPHFRPWRAATHRPLQFTAAPPSNMQCHPSTLRLLPPRRLRLQSTLRRNANVLPHQRKPSGAEPPWRHQKLAAARSVSESVLAS